ncbi:MAG: LysR family transcriptional regulator [Cellvibrionaceae bacterium]
MDKLNLINQFLTVSRCGSFVAAAAELGVDPSTVSKAIQQLEKHLNIRLFSRTTRQLQLTPAAEVYRQKCLDLVGGLEACEKQLSLEQVEPAGKLKVNVPVSYGQMYITPMLERFVHLYPKIDLELSLSDDYVDIVSQSIDVAIRSGQLKDSRLVARKLSPMDFATCASPEFLSKNKKITNANIEKQPWVLYRFLHTGKIMPIYGIRGKAKLQQSYEINPKPVLVTTDGLSMVKACQSGLGLIQAPHFLLRSAILEGSLNVVQSFYRSKGFNVYAYYSQKEYMPAKVRVFLDYIVEELKAMGEDHNTTFLSK